jgi:oligosaccharyltransferase complex subunit beta
MNPYLIDVLHGAKTSYIGEDRALDEDEVEVESQVKGGKEVIVGGKRAGLVSAMQTRSNVRVGFVGSGEIFADTWWNKDIEGLDGKQSVSFLVTNDA